MALRSKANASAVLSQVACYKEVEVSQGKYTFITNAFPKRLSRRIAIGSKQDRWIVREPNDTVKHWCRTGVWATEPEIVFVRKPILWEDLPEEDANVALLLSAKGSVFHFVDGHMDDGSPLHAPILKSKEAQTYVRLAYVEVPLDELRRCPRPHLGAIMLAPVLHRKEAITILVAEEQVIHAKLGDKCGKSIRIHPGSNTIVWCLNEMSTHGNPDAPQGGFPGLTFRIPVGYRLQLVSTSALETSYAITELSEVLESPKLRYAYTFQPDKPPACHVLLAKMKESPSPYLVARARNSEVSLAEKDMPVVNTASSERKTLDLNFGSLAVKLRSPHWSEILFRTTYHRLFFQPVRSMGRTAIFC